MKVTLENGVLKIEIPTSNPPELSASGKSRVVASTRGNMKTNVIVDGKPLTIGLNAYIQS